MTYAGDSARWCAKSSTDTSVLVVQLLSSEGAIVTTRSPNGISGYVPTKKAPSIAVAILLFFIRVIPAVIFLVNHSKGSDKPFAITLVADGTGTRISGDGQGRGLNAVLWAIGQVAGFNGGGQTVYSTTEWDGPTIRAITDALDERSISRDAEATDLVVSSRHEAPVDTVVLSITGEAPVDRQQPTPSNQLGPGIEFAYDADDWTPEQFRAITQSLDAAEIAWFAEDGALVAPAAAESTVDELVEQFTDHRPGPATVGDAESTGGWRPDPYNRHHLRWFDGDIWTDHMSDDGTVGQDPAGNALVEEPNS